MLGWVIVYLGSELGVEQLHPPRGLGPLNLDAADGFTFLDGYEVPGAVAPSCPDDLVPKLLQSVLSLILVGSSGDVVTIWHGGMGRL